MALRRASSTFFNKLVHSTTRQSVHNNVAPHRNFSSGTFLISLLSLFYPLFGLRENRRKISFFFSFFSSYWYLVAEKTEWKNRNEVPSSMETENEGNEKILSVVGVWLLRKLWERMETEKSNPFLGGQIYCLVAKKMKEMEKGMKLFFFWGISESVMNFYLLSPNYCINLIWGFESKFLFECCENGK